jgi:hypothetical protein
VFAYSQLSRPVYQATPHTASIDLNGKQEGITWGIDLNCRDFYQKIYKRVKSLFLGVFSLFSHTFQVGNTFKWKMY